MTAVKLTGANLVGANPSGADLSSVIWVFTTCPDGTNSDLHNHTCGGHFNGAVPAAGC